MLLNVVLKDLMTWQESLTLAIALVGAVLGVMNYWRSLDHDRVHIKVTPKWYVTSYGGDGICVEVLNLGFIPVTINQIALDVGGGNVYVSLVSANNSLKLPKRMEPRTEITFYFPLETANQPNVAYTKRALARTACGKTFYGTSPALKSWVAGLSTT